MKTVTNRPSFQGDLMVRQIAKVPAEAVPAEAVNGKHTVAHSETGHNHTVLERSAQMLIDQTNEFIAYLKVSGDDGAVIKHERSFDTHEPIHLPPGNYEIRRQREYIAEGFRRAAD